jgi:nucleotide-binding universal stress UspA family protein
MNEQLKTGERVFLVVVDESPEMRNALRYACRRAKRTGGRVAMLYVMDSPEGQQWGSVVELMREEARQQAETVVAQHADVAVSMTGQPPSIYIREGKSRDEVPELSQGGAIAVLAGRPELMQLGKLDEDEEPSSIADEDTADE